MDLFNVAKKGFSAALARGFWSPVKVANKFFGDTNRAEAIANLDRARQGQEQRLYDHGLNVQRQQVEHRRQQFDVSQLVAARDAVAGQLAEMAAVRSPYGGTVRRVRVLGQADRLMSVEVVVETMVKDGAGAEWLGATAERGEGRAKAGQPPVKAGAEWSDAAP